MTLQTMMVSFGSSCQLLMRKKDVYLNQTEATNFRNCTTPQGAKCTEQRYLEACHATGSDPARGLDLEALRKLFRALKTLHEDYETVRARLSSG